ncbi:MAG: dTDP-4-dehydrorhamnose reductase [Chloroflexi bacterium]|nr:dTDP-4-dehydrorhamnose reductase [Chloroflexota bacterium]
MRIAVTGIKGQLGRTLAPLLEREHTVLGLDLPEDDITNLNILDTLQRLAPDLVVHAAAMTHVDGCAVDPDAAYRANALGTRNVALACQRANAVMMYLSTNEVFDGAKDAPYLEFDETRPINPYAASKLAGERFVQSLLNRYYIVRTAWLFGCEGANFVTRITQLADQLGELRVVTDEIGSPTYARDLAEALCRLIKTDVWGVYHLTNSGGCSRYDFARRILELSGRSGVPVTPITSSEFQRSSCPPRYSCLRNFCAASLGITLRSWEEALAAYLLEMGPHATRTE